MQRKTLLPIIVGIALVAAVGLTIALSGDDGEGARVDGASPPSGIWQPRAWALDGARTVALELDSNGPRIRTTPSQAVAMTPSIEGLTLSWKLVPSGEERIVMEGRGQLHGAEVVSTWQFAQGNPQAYFTMRVENLKATSLDRDLVAKLQIPSGEVRFVNDALRIDTLGDDAHTVSGWSPGWLRWAGEGSTLELSNWWADSVTVTPQASGVEVALTIFDREAQPRAACEDPTLTLETRFMLSAEAFGAVFPGRLEKGASAAAVPVFIPPSTHYHTGFQELRLEDPADWASQARTLAMGHSNPRDPRHGNGGMIGTHLGATFIYPSRFADKSPIIELQSALVETPTQILRGGEDTAFVAPGCTEDFIWLREGSRSSGKFENPLTNGLDSGFGAKGVLSLPVVVLDGTRTQLVDQALSKLYLERLGRERGLFPFAAPLVGTRNPLIQAAAEALLVPERGGEWTVDEDVVRNFAELELWREEHPEVIVSSVESVATYWGRARACVYAHSQNGFPVVRCDSPTQRLTVILDGEYAPLLGEVAVSHDVRDSKTHAQTWAWLDVENEAELEISVENRPSSVRWTLPTK